MRQQTWLWAVVLGGAAIGLGCADDPTTGSTAAVAQAAVASRAAKAPPSRTLAPNTNFMLRLPDQAAVNQIASTLKKRDLIDSLRLGVMEAMPQAIWFNGGTPQQVQADVRKTMAQAALTNGVPILVAYNLPFRDCAQYSAGGALDTASYEAWIDAFAAGIGNRQAVVILEPDGLGLIPYNTTIFGASEWCQPTVTGDGGISAPAPGASEANRYAQLNYAVDAIESHAPAAALYLDGTHSAWLGVGEAAARLYNAGVQRAQGFFINVSNYQPTDQATQFGTWVSDCIAAATAGASWAIGHFDYCPSQYDPATNYTTVNYTPAFEAGVTASLAGMLGTAVATTRFVIDTSRNGKGTLDTSPYAAAPYDQSTTVIAALTSGDWCNPPGAGLGLRPTANSGVALLDAYLWVKTPGESDGSCAINGGARAWDFTAYNPWNVSGAAQSTFDPLWGIVDPAAGDWFAQQALQLAQNATPPLI
jgi:endoglucanase